MIRPWIPRWFVWSAVLFFYGFASELLGEQIALPRKALLHLDAQGLAEQLGKSEPGKFRVETWTDSQSSDLRWVPSQPEQAPMLHVGQGWSSVRFDGIDDALRLELPSAGRPSTGLASASIWLVVACYENPGDFRGVLAANAPGQRDYVSGLNIDMGPGPGLRWDMINVEGRGFSGVQNMNPNPIRFGTLQILEVRLDPVQKRCVLSVNGKQTGDREWTESHIAIDQWTLGARFYTNGPGPQEVRGHTACDISELIVFDGTLSSEESQDLYKQLQSKHRRLAEVLPTEVKLAKESDRLIKLENPPELQMLQGGFDVHRLPLELTNINNVLYRPDGTLVTLGYNGDVHLLRDTDADGLEDQAKVFYKNAGSLRGPIGMVLTRPDDPRGFGVFVSSKGKVSLLLDRDRDEVCDEEIVVAKGWEEIPQNVDAVGLAMASDGSLYFGLGAANYANAYLLDEAGQSRFDLQSERGTIQKVSPDFSKRETVCTGVRFPIGIAFGPNGDLFCTDQEGATWLANGNPFDELLHIEPTKHYGFPPRHPQYNPTVLDEPSLFDYGPQHQSTCGLFFNPSKDSPNRFGPATWGGNAIVAGESRGRLWRTQLVRSENGYVAQTQPIASLQKLTIDSCVSPAGDLLVACHSGPPDWGTGPAGIGTLYKIRSISDSISDSTSGAISGAIARPILAWRTSPNELSIAFDQPVDPTRWTEFSKNLRIESGVHVRAGDRYENLVPPYAVVQSQGLAARKLLPLHQVGLSPDLRTLTLGFPANASLDSIAVSLPSGQQPSDSETSLGSPNSRIAQRPELEVDASPYGVYARWSGSADGAESWSGWLPHMDLRVAKSLTAGSATHDRFWELIEGSGELELRTQLDLRDIYRPKLQPGSKIDYVWPEESVTIRLEARGSEGTSAPDMRIGTSESQATIRVARKPGDSDEVWFDLALESVDRTGPVRPLVVTLSKAAGSIEFLLSVATAESPKQRALPLVRFWMPWVQRDPTSELELQQADAQKVAEIPELRGGNWGNGRRWFFSDSLGCVKCHSEPGSGRVSTIGPDLSNLPSRDYASNVRDIIQPSHAIHPEYIGHRIELKDGTVLTGVLRDQEGSLMLGDMQGKTQRLERDQIERIVPSKTSVMPTGLLDKLTEDQVRDLMTYLMKPPPSMPLSGPIAAPSVRTANQVAEVLAGSSPLPEPLRRMRVVLVAGPKDHGPAEHDYPAWLMQWGQLLTAAEALDVEVAWEFPVEEQLATADVLVFFQKGSWDLDRAKSMDRYFGRGGGAIYLHWAVNGSDRVEDFSKRIGLASWGGKIKYRHGPLELRVTDKAHPIMRNVPTMDLLDESYWLLTGDTSRIGLLATSQEDGLATPQLWTYEPGQGRVFVSIPGHYSWTFDDPIFRTVILRAMAWTAREPIDRFNALVPLGARMK